MQDSPRRSFCFCCGDDGLDLGGLRESAAIEEDETWGLGFAAKIVGCLQKHFHAQVVLGV
jgi:hypothetical protein